MANQSIIKLFAPCVLAATLACNNSQQHQQDDVSLEEYPIYTLTPQAATVYTDFPVNLQGVQDIELRSKVSGFIDDIFVDEGQYVNKGQLLFRIFAPEYEEELARSSAAIKSTEAELADAQLLVDRTKPLVDEGIIGKYELESALQNLANKNAQLSQAKAIKNTASANVAYSQIRAPFAGVMGLIPYKTGSLVSSSSIEPLSHLSDISKIHAYFSINEKQFTRFLHEAKNKSLLDYLQQHAEIALILPDGNQFDQKGKIDMIGGQIDPKTGSINLRAVFQNPDGMMRSGNSATLRMYEKVQEAILIPQRATYELQGKKYVYKVDDESVVTSAPISILDKIPSNEYFIVSDGLQRGEKIIVEGLANVKEGMKIKTVNK
ncbi:efflux RND transporter periplasmic adaptor subunit [Sphingobacterium cellulitidis]|uniref:efflux RND transporter periplasmic adaptor subunit n=1 Tax=Sphingobacterium cellulitidis TaxID=1768011 RepID=UPI000B93EFFE|nr:efflux transporter periplasmic adaptor subunit [Sphingobacterium cellulitidis]